MKHQGLGDTVESITKATGIKAIFDAGSKVLKNHVDARLENKG